MKKQTILLISLLLALCSQLMNAQIPRTLSYQGVLTDSLGNPKPDGSYSLTFRLYDTESSGSALWTEVKTLDVKRGLFTTVLGDQVIFVPTLKFDKQYWLSIQVASQPELSPRVPLSAVGYSFNSLKADTAQYARSAPSQAYVDSARIASTIPNNTVTNAKIVDGTIQFADIAQNGAASGQVMKWNGSAWAPAVDATGGGSGGWSDNGTQIELATSSDTVNIGSSSPIGKLHVNGDIGLSSLSSIKFGNDANRITANSGDLRFVSEDLSMLTTGDITVGHYGDETWAKFDNTNKRLGIGTLTPEDKLHIRTSLSSAPAFLRTESGHATNFGEAGFRIKTPQNTWHLRMDDYTNNNTPNGSLSLRSGDLGAEVSTWLENGNVGIGTTNPLKKLHVWGSAQVKDTLYASAVNAGRIINGPGLVNSSGPEGIHLSYPATVLDSITIQAPTAGHIMVIYSGTLYSNHDYGDQAEATISLSVTREFPDRFAITEWFFDQELSTGGYMTPLYLHAIRTIPTAGSYTYYLLGHRYDDLPGNPDDFMMYSNAFTAVFIPNAYGTVDPSSKATTREFTPLNTIFNPSQQSGGLIEGKQTDLESLRNQVNALTSELKSLKNKIDSQEK